MYKVSIIIINYNYCEYLQECIESCLNQTSPPFEVIIVDDGSTDNSRALIQSYSDRIYAVFNSNQGHVASVNSGFKKSTGDICLFLDADDYLYSGCILQVLKSWDQTLSKIQYRLDTIDRYGNNQNMQFPNFHNSLTAEEVLRQSLHYGVYPWTVSSGNVFSRKFLDDIMPIDEKQIYRSPDGYLNKVAPLFGRVKSLKDVLGAYRVHGSNAWAQDSKHIKIGPIVRWLNFDIVLQKSFISHALSKGILLPDSREIRSLQQLEYRMIASRLAGGESPYPKDDARILLLKGINFIPKAPNVTIMGKIYWFIWIFAIAFFPTSLLKTIYLSARGQIGRKKIFNRIIKRSQKSM